MTLSQTNWVQAIEDARLEGLLKKEQPSIAAELGELALGSLFGVLTKLGKKAASLGVERAAHAASTYDDVYGTAVQIAGPDKADVELANHVADATVEAGSKIFEKHATGESLHDLEEKARQPQLPVDRDGLLAAFDAAPGKWAATICEAVPNLPDDALAELMTKIPKALQKDDFKINELVARFDSQVASISADRIAVEVFNKHGLRRVAIVGAEMAANNDLKGEWKGSEYRTGRWSFAEWATADMEQMAMTRTRHGDGTPLGFQGKGDKAQLVTNTMQQAHSWMEPKSFWADDDRTREALEKWDDATVPVEDDLVTPTSVGAWTSR